jgi:L-malate glycosyltransferase
MRILMLNYEFPPIGGGASNAIYHVLREFSEKDLEIELITSSAGTYAEERFSKNIMLYRLDVGKKSHHYQSAKETLLWSLKTMRLMPKLLKKNYDLCHCWFGWPPGFFGYLHRKRLPYVVSLRGTDVPGFNPRTKVLDKLVFKSLSRKIWGAAGSVVANSEGLKKLANYTWKGKIEIIPNGVDTEKFHPGKKKGRFTLLAVSRLIERKGLNYIIDAMPFIKDVRLVIAGDGPEMQSLKSRAKSLGVSDKVNFLGKVEHDRLPQVYRQADIFILPSIHEGMSNTLLEAMASGLPVIVTDTGGTKELVKDNGIIIRKKSSDDIKKAVTKLFDEKLRKRYSANSRKMAEQHSWKKVADKYRELYVRNIRV